MNWIEILDGQRIEEYFYLTAWLMHEDWLSNSVLRNVMWGRFMHETIYYSVHNMCHVLMTLDL